MPDAVYASFSELVLSLGFRAMADLLADQHASGLAAAFSVDHLKRAKSRLL